MEGLEKLEQVQRNIHLLHSVGVSDANPDAERFLADFTSFLMQDCGELDVSLKCQLITKHMSKVVDLLISDATQPSKKGCSQIKNLHSDDKTNPDPVQSLHSDVYVIGIDAMIRSNSTLEDFCRSYFVFHKMDANQPHSIFKNLPMLSFTESYIYQLDDLNEKLLQLPTGEVSSSTEGFEDDEPSPCANSVQVFEKNPFRPLFRVLERYGLLTERIKEELRYGEEYWHLERKLCCALARNKEISIEDVTRAIHLKSFDYRVLNLLLYQLRGEKVNELHMEFLSVSELLVEVSDDLSYAEEYCPMGFMRVFPFLAHVGLIKLHQGLTNCCYRFDYEGDVAENSFNILRMFVKCYGASAAPIMLAQFISEVEEKYDLLFKALDQELSVKYRERCEEATREGGKTCGPSLGTWHIPPVIEDEAEYRRRAVSSKARSMADLSF